MFSFCYKGHYIQGYFDKPICKIVFMVDNHPSKILQVNSFRAAQLRITKLIKEQKQ